MARDLVDGLTWGGALVSVDLVRRALRWAVANPLSAGTILGVCLFGMVRLGYALFYGEFAATPEEAGLGYKETIAQSALVLLTLILLLTFSFLMGMIVWLGYVILGTIFGEALGRTGHPLARVLTGARWSQAIVWSATRQRASVRASPPIGKILRDFYSVVIWFYGPGRARRLRETIFSRRGLTRLFYLALLFGIVVLLVILTIDARSAAHQARSGHPVHPSTLFGIPFLFRRAETATVYATGRRTTKELGIRRGDCILYLGASNNTELLYDYDPSTNKGRTLRIPSWSIAVGVPATVSNCKN